MNNSSNNPGKKAPVVFIPHGGGPLPLLDDPGHLALTDFLRQLGRQLPRPDAIVVISAHWETEPVRVTVDPEPEMIYDYHGFPDETYQLSYPAPGAPDLAGEIIEHLNHHGLSAQAQSGRGYDHGLYVPLMLMYPEADIPCVQVSLLNNLDPGQHIELGRALAPLREKNILFLGAGLSFHNMRLFYNDAAGADNQIDAFHQWLGHNLTEPNGNDRQRQHALTHWADAPGARLCHPREEHLLPLHVCLGLAEGDGTAKVLFDDRVLGRRAMAFGWGF